MALRRADLIEKEGIKRNVELNLQLNYLKIIHDGIGNGRANPVGVTDASTHIKT